MQFLDFEKLVITLESHVMMEHSTNQGTERNENEKKCMNINKGGLVSNNHKLGDTEVVNVTDNIYYETADLEKIQKQEKAIKDEKICMGINKGGLVSNDHNHGETEVIDFVSNIYYESVYSEGITNDDKNP